jgi:hypothetical protein
MKKNLCTLSSLQYTITQFQIKIYVALKRGQWSLTQRSRSTWNFTPRPSSTSTTTTTTTTTKISNCTNSIVYIHLQKWRVYSATQKVHRDVKFIVTFTKANKCIYDFKLKILQTWHVVLVGFSNCSSWSPILFDSASLYERKKTDLEKQKKLAVAIQTQRSIEQYYFLRCDTTLLAFSASSSTIKMEAAYFSEMSVNFYQTTCPQIR